MRMIGKSTQVCRMPRCRCCNAAPTDKKGRAEERRLAKHKEKARWREQEKVAS